MVSEQLKRMVETDARPGKVAWIGLRAARREPVQAVRTALIEADGLVGDHGRPGKRAVTLIQQEHLPVIAAFLGREGIDPADLRRNVMVSDLNLANLRGAEIALGEAVVKIEGPCPPCSRMEETFGPGGYGAVRGHGGWYARVVHPAPLNVGDEVVRISG